MNATRPEAEGRKEVPLRHGNKVAGIVGYDGTRVPVTFSQVCRDQECCPRRAGFVAVHTWTLYGDWNGRGVGEYVTAYVPRKGAG